MPSKRSNSRNWIIINLRIALSKIRNRINISRGYTCHWRRQIQRTISREKMSKNCSWLFDNSNLWSYRISPRPRQKRLLRCRNATKKARQLKWIITIQRKVNFLTRRGSFRINSRSICTQWRSPVKAVRSSELIKNSQTIGFHLRTQDKTWIAFKKWRI